MTIRKRKRRTPAFGPPSPYNPMSGEYAPLQIPGVSPFCALMQVAAEDTHDNYVICRGYDTLTARFIDYDAPDLPN